MSETPAEHRGSRVRKFPHRAAVLDPKAPHEIAAAFRAQYRTTGNIDGIQCAGGDFFQWEDGAWRELPADLLRSMLYAWMPACVDDRGAPLKPNRRNVGDVIEALAAASLLRLRRAPAWLPGYEGDADPADLLVVRNGLVHIPTRQLRPANPALFAPTVLPVTFDPRAGEPRAWLHFLGQLWGNDVEAIQLLQEWIGVCCLSGDTSLQKALLLIGPRRSGKGTILRVMRELAGAENVCSPTFASLGTHFGLQSLIGKRVAFLSDARFSNRTDLAVVAENLLRITGEDAVSVPRKHRADWTGTLTTRFTIATNELPRLADASSALSGRFVILRLDRSFYGHEDARLTDKLLTELPAILLWAMRGLERLRARGRLVQPASAQEAADELEALASPVTMFVRERCVLDPVAESPVSLIFDVWRDWCAEQGREHPGQASTLGQNLRHVVPQLRVTQPRREGRQVRCWTGIRPRFPGDRETGEAR